MPIGDCWGFAPETTEIQVKTMLGENFALLQHYKTKICPNPSPSWQPDRICKYVRDTGFISVAPGPSAFRFVRSLELLTRSVVIPSPDAEAGVSKTILF
jgi:hypothetical protein